MLIVGKGILQTELAEDPMSLYLRCTLLVEYMRGLLVLVGLFCLHCVNSFHQIQLPSVFVTETDACEFANGSTEYGKVNY